VALTTTDPSAESASAHRAFAVAAFNRAWELIETAGRTPEQDRQLLALACASRWHWSEIGTDENIAVSDWQVAHAASLIGEPGLALSFATAAYERARTADLPGWLRASTAEGMARACAAAADRATSGTPQKPAISSPGWTTRRTATSSPASSARSRHPDAGRHGGGEGESQPCRSPSLPLSPTCAPECARSSTAR
jgi:hypothetical protein